jgi:hypothetical protein
VKGLREGERESKEKGNAQKHTCADPNKTAVREAISLDQVLRHVASQRVAFHTFP